MATLGTFILDFLAQFGGGRGGMENELARFSLAALFWGALLVFSVRRRAAGRERERLLTWGFALGLARELLMLAVFSLELLGRVPFEKFHFVFPPLEHALTMASVLLVAGGFIRYLLDDPAVSRRFLQVGLGVTAFDYFATFAWWPWFLAAHPEVRFGQTWCDWLFRLTAVALLLWALVLLARRRGVVGGLVFTALSFFFLDEFLMLFQMWGGEPHPELWAPVRHNLHIWAIPLLCAVYLLELGEEQTRTNAALRAALDEKGVLLREVHHRVKNNLQSINGILELHRVLLKDREQAQVYRDCQNRVTSMALIHEKLYQTDDLVRVPMAWYLEVLGKHLWHSFGSPARVTVKVRGDHAALNPDTAIPCGLLVTELVGNSLKYAFPGARQGTVLISLREGVGGTFELTVEDDGVGLPPEFDLARAKTLGLRLVSSLAEQLGGRLTLGARGAAGTRFALVFREYQEAGSTL